MKSMNIIQQMVFLAGIGQVGLVIGSFAIPGILNWKQELGKVQPLIKQMFWVYAVYIAVINTCFGLLSIFNYQALINHSNLAMLLTGFIAVYWISRVLIQFLYFDRTNFPAGRWHKIGESVLVLLFVFFSVVYSYAAYVNFKHI